MSLTLGDPLHRLERVDSTSLHLKRLAAEGAPVGTVVTAEIQTAGYGQRGRIWVSEPGAGLYVSMLLPVPKAPTQLPFVLGLGVRDALAELSPAVRLKWVNDLVAERRKLGGMLVEMSSRHAVAGVGLNLRLQPVADAIALDELGVAISSEALLERLLRGVERRHAQWLAEGFAPIKADWAAASVTLGAEVQIIAEGAAPLFGRAEGLGPNGELLLRRPDGGLETVVAGSVRAADGAYC